MSAPEVLDPAVNRLVQLAGNGRALEFAIGTGRIDVPLTERGISVLWIELSQPMIDQLRTKHGGNVLGETGGLSVERQLTDGRCAG
jgi:hypothetical protein